MALMNEVKEVLHKIRVKLYPNYLPGAGGAYLARTDNDATLSIEEVCAAMKKRGGFTGNYDTLVENVKQFLDEAAYQLCDGFAVNTGYFSVQPNVGGTFESVNEVHDGQKHPVTFRFRTLSPLRALADEIVVEVAGLADVTGYIDEFTDVATDSTDEALTPGGQFILTGNKIKVAGTNAENGVYFVSVSDPSQRVKVTRNFAQNTPVKVIGIVPSNLAPGQWTVEVVTQYSSGGNKFLKDPRTYQYKKVLTVTASAPIQS